MTNIIIAGLDVTKEFNRLRRLKGLEKPYNGTWDQWTIKARRGMNRMGNCRSSTRTITLKACLSDPIRVAETLLHEMVHAVIPSLKVNGRRVIHGTAFKERLAEVAVRARYINSPLGLPIYTREAYDLDHAICKRMREEGVNLPLLTTDPLVIAIQQRVGPAKPKKVVKPWTPAPGNRTRYKSLDSVANHPGVECVEHEGRDGYWVYLHEDWLSGDDCHTIHEYTIGDVFDAMKHVTHAPEAP